MTSHPIAAVIAAKFVLGGSLVLGMALTPTMHAKADDTTTAGAQCVQSSPDSPCTWIDPATGRQMQEDDPLWSCVDMGDRICGPGNSNGVPAGCYDDGGAMVAPWPCRVVINPDGSSDVYQ